MAVAFAAVLPIANGAAQEEVANRQERARIKFDELHERMRQLESVLADTEPDESRVLQAGNRLIQEFEIHEDMRVVAELLKEESWDQALTQMDQLRRELTKLMDLLLNRDTDLQKILEQIEEWEKYKERLEGLIDEQQREKDDAAKTEALEKLLQDLEQAKQRVDQIMVAQEVLRDETNQAGMAAAPQTAEQMADRQGELKQTTEDLADDLAQIEKDAAQLETQEGEAGAGQAGEPKAGSPSEGGASAAGAGSSSGSASSAASSMGQSQQKLQQNKPESSLQDQDQALDKLQGLRDQLDQLSEEARRKLLALPFEQQLKAQETTQIDTATLAKDMEQGQSADRSGEPTGAPGTKNVQQAVPKQQSAAGMLEERKPGSAKQKQQDAKEELEEAQRQLDEALEQLRQELQDEVLRSLEERFGAMLARQKELSAGTRAVERLRGESLAATEGMPASLAQRCEEISGGELGLASEAGSALQLLQEEGTTAVFPAIIEILKEDLEHVADSLATYKTGATTQKDQADIEETLRMLINALRKQIEENEGQPGEAGESGEPPLVPMSAELKLIMFLQQRVADRTKSYDTDVPQQLRVTEQAAEEALGISRKQGQVEDLTRKLAVKINKENQGGDRK